MLSATVNYWDSVDGALRWHSLVPWITVLSQVARRKLLGRSLPIVIFVKSLKKVLRIKKALQQIYQMVYRWI